MPQTWIAPGRSFAAAFRRFTVAEDAENGARCQQDLRTKLSNNLTGAASIGF
jgi:hypothetical protein